MEEEEDDGSPPLMEPALPFDKQAKQLYPVSITWQPPFSMLVDLKGHGDLQAWLPRLSVIYAMHPMHAAAQPLFHNRQALLGRTAVWQSCSAQIHVLDTPHPQSTVSHW